MVYASACLLLVRFFFTVLPTCHFVSHQLGRLDLSNAVEEASQLILSHTLRQVVHYQVSLCILRLIPAHVIFITVRHLIHVLQVSQLAPKTNHDKHTGGKQNGELRNTLYMFFFFLSVL